MRIEIALSRYIYVLKVYFTLRVTGRAEMANASRTLRLKLSQHGRAILKNAAMIYRGVPSILTVRWATFFAHET